MLDYERVINFLLLLLLIIIIFQSLQGLSMPGNLKFETFRNNPGSAETP